MNITGKRIRLRAIEEDDLDQLREWSNDPATAIGLGDIHFPTSRSMQRQWYERSQADERTVRLAVEDEKGALVGLTGFWDIHWRDRRAEHAVVVGNESSRGKGYGREIIATCARYAFQDMGLYRLDATILESNEASLALYESCGYVREGLLRGHALRGSERVNRVVLGLLAEDHARWVEASGYWDDPNEGT